MPSAPRQRKREDCLPIPNGDGAYTVPLTKGYVAVVDEADHDRVASVCWTTWKRPRGEGIYAIGNLPGNGPSVRMHRLLLCFPFLNIDHRDGNGLNNRRSNLRVCTPSQNGRNRRVVRGKSKYKGVCLVGGKRPWEAQILVEGKSVKLGTYLTEFFAARAYDNAALEAFGEFAPTNAALGLLQAEAV